MAFPLFTQQMYNALTYKWANTLFALIATLMIPIPFVSLRVALCIRPMLTCVPQILFKWGPRIRANSKFASKVMEKSQ